MNRLGGGFAADGLDVAGSVRDVGDVDIDQHQADLLQLRLDGVLDVVQELLAVAIDILNVHRGNHLPQLPENDVLGLLFDMRRIESQQPNGRVLHDRRFDADGDGEDAGDVDTNILNRKRIAQRHFDLDGLQMR